MAGRQPQAWPLRILLGLSVVAPLILFAWAAWSGYRAALAEAERTGTRTVTALHEHAAKVLDTHRVVLRAVDSRLSGRSWEEISGDDDLRRDLEALAQELDQIGSITVADSTGAVRATSHRANYRSIAHREAFTVHMDQDAGLFVSGPFTGQVDGIRKMAISQRRTTRDGAFDGVLVATVPIAYLTDFWEQFAPTIAHIIPLIREDGQVIARHPAVDNPDRLNPNGPFLSRARVEPQGFYTAVSQVDGVERMNAYSRVDDFPLFISFSIETGALFRAWYREMALHAFYTLLAAFALLATTLMAIRQDRMQRAATERWHEAAERLRKEIEAREKAETALVQAQKMEALGQLTGGIAHDFNNLLQTMSSSFYFLRKRAPQEARPIIDASMLSVERGARLVRQLLAFARRQRLEPRPVDLRALLANMGELLQNAVGEAVVIDVEVEPYLAPVLVDPTQAELAILNLAINARDAMEGTGRITIRAHRLKGAPSEVVALGTGSYVVLSISDSGCGMLPEVRARAFDPFFTTKDTGKGTGLGLSMIHGFATQSGGAVEIESEHGQGTTLIVYLPEAAQAVEPEPEPHLLVRPARSGEVILFVDDEALARTVTAEGLREIGYEVHEARNGKEALAILDQGVAADVLVTDFAMPGMTGLGLAAAARTRLPNLPVILVTGYAAFEEASGLLSVVLRKPFRVEELAQQVRLVLSQAGRVVASQPCSNQREPTAAGGEWRQQ
jgi:two-component system, NtrC family, sensor kinase